jgi:hypothetical protein
MSKRDLILQEALALDDTDRAYVRDMLEQSLPNAPFASPELAEDWYAEIDRRIEQADNGEVTFVSEEEVLREMEAKLPPGPSPNHCRGSRESASELLAESHFLGREANGLVSC